MQKEKFKLLRIFSILVILLAIVSSFGGILIEDLYRDNSFVTLIWKTTDMVTLIVAVPLLLSALVFASRGSVGGLIILLAILDYTLYNFAYYLFGAAFNGFFLIYVLLVVFSAAALITGLVGIDVHWVKARFRAKTPVRWISGYMLFVAAGLTTIYLTMISGFIFSGELPIIIEKTGHVTNVVFALDLTLVVPVLIVGAIWLWKRKPWGFVLAGFSVIKGTLYTFVLAVVSIKASCAGFPDAAGEIPLWLALTAGGLAASSVFLLKARPADETPSHLST